MTKKHVPLWLKGVVAVVIAAHLALIGAAIAGYASTTPALDEWHERMNSAIALKTAQGSLRLSDIFTNYNGHRLPISFALTALNTVLFRYDPRFEMLLTAALLVVNFSLLALIMNRQLGQGTPRLFWLGLIPLAAMVFTGRWLQGWTWGFMNLWQFGILFTLLGVIFADRVEIGWRLAALLTLVCTLAAFSNSAGILAFGVVGLVWWVRGERHLLRLALFGVAAAFCFIIVFLSDRHGYAQITLSPFENTYFVALHLGAVQLTPPVLRYGVLPPSAKDFALLTFVVGCFFVAINAHFLLRRLHHTKLIMIAALIMWGLGFALATSIGRFDVYIDFVLHLDYHTPVAMMFWVGAFILSLCVIQKSRGALRMANLLFVACVLCAQIIFTLIALLHVIAPLMRFDENVTSPRECPLTSLIGNNNCSVFHLIPTEMIHSNALGLAELKIGPFKWVEQQPVSLALHFLPVLHTSEVFNEPEREAKAIVLSGTAQYVLFQHTARLAQSLELPDLPDYHFTLRGALSLESACADQSIQARLMVEDGQTQRIAIEQTASTDLVPFALDLTDLRGRAFTLLYELETPEPLACGHVLWANPRIEFSLTPQVP
ncbi:MAG: hypothetical protein DYG88_06715 [Chloroflexi bacterium CFX4]|nr:hypothetical protein [Chloroflexi bacterium CFX4]MDL1922098.1 hypothetical protein [Chloroflexi bacterium CFX3]